MFKVSSQLDNRSMLSMVIGTLISLLLASFITYEVSEYHTHKLGRELDALASQVERQMQHTVNALDSTVALYHTKDDVTRSNFSVFTDHLLQKRSLIALEYIPKVTRDERELYVRRAREDGLINFHFTETKNGKQQIRHDVDVLYPIYYVAPLQGHEDILGFDLSSHPLRNELLHEAIKNKEAVASNPITLMQQVQKQNNGVLIAKPMYKASVMQGFIIGVLDIRQFFLVNIEHPDDFSVFTESNEEQLIYYNNEKTSIIKELPSHSYLFNKIKFLNQYWWIGLNKEYIFIKSILIGLTVFIIFMIITGLVFYEFYKNNISKREALEQFDKNEKKVNQMFEAMDIQREKLSILEKKTMIASMVASLTHEMKTPISVINTAVTELLDSMKELITCHEQQRLTQTFLKEVEMKTLEAGSIIKSSNLMIIDLVEAYSDASIDDTQAEIKQFRVKSCINQVLLAMRPKLRKTKHDITIHCDDTLEVTSYSNFLSQILINLINNSLLHGFENIISGEITIDVSINEDNNLVCIYQDNGCGIKDSIKEKIFDNYFTTKKNKGGTGLGLNIVFNIVTNILMGSITCESTPGKGVTFIITYPIAE